MYHSVVGQILAINELDNPKVITLETPRGDTVYLRYGSDAIGSTPLLGGVYTISYQVDAGILRVVEIRKPEPGQYKAEFQKGPDIERGADFEQLSRAPSPTNPADPIFGARTSRTTSDDFSPTTRPTDPIFERRTPRTSPDDYAPTTSVLEGVRPDGITLIVVMLLLIGSFGTFIGLLFTALWFTAFLGIIILGVSIASLLLMFGLWTYRAWARTGVIVLSVLICLTLVGIIVGGPIIWYLEQKHVKQMFIY